MTDHNTIKELLCAYYDGEATAEEEMLIKNHIKECRECSLEYKNFSKISQSLKLYPEENPSPDLEYKLSSNQQEGKMQNTNVKSKLDSILKPILAGEFIIIIAAVILIGHLATTEGLKKLASGRLKSAADDIGQQYSLKNNTIVAKSSTADSRSRQQEYKKLNVTQNSHINSQPSSQAVQYEPYYLQSSYPMTTDGRQDMLQEKYLNKSSTDISRAAMGGYPGIEAGYESIMPQPYPMTVGQFNTEEYSTIIENEFLTVSENPLSTFSIDVDTASYSNVRRYINASQLPPVDAVRIEEMINYFNYDYPNPEGDMPFSITTKAAKCPWNKEHDLFLIGLQGKVPEEVPPSNLVFLIDTSGSMNQPNKLPLLISAFSMMVNQLTDKERVAIVTYAGSAGKVLDSTKGDDKQTILDSLNRLYAGGSTAGNAGVQLAYKIAKDNFIKGGNNRVILATDGDFNVGVSSTSELTKMIEEKRKEGVFLTILGFGDGNYKDGRMQELADKGNGNYYYIDTLKEAKKVLVSELGSTLFTIAKDVKIQVEFNPAQVKAYKLIGYESRMLKKEDFNDDTKDAGELGAGHTVTAIYEIVRGNSNEEFTKVDDLKYQEKKIIKSDEMMTVKLRYKDPDGDTSKLIQETIGSQDIKEEPAGDFKFASAVAEYGLLLRNSKFKGTASYQNVLKSAKESKGEDKFGYREEFIQLVDTTNTLDSRSSSGGINFK